MKKMRLFIILILAICLCACGSSSNLDELLELGAKYLDEQNYEEAIIAFTQAIEIDEKCAEAYIGLADAYICIEEYDKAEDILKRGYELTGDEKLKEMLESLESGQIKTSDGLVRRKNHYNEKNELDWYHTYTYDNKNRQSLVTSFDGNGKQTGQVQYEFDPNGNVKIAHYYDGKSGRVGVMRQQYDQKGNCVKTVFDYGTYIKRDYDDNGMMIREEQYDESGNLDLLNICEYTADSQTKKFYDSNGKYFGKEVILYDDNGRMISYSSYGADNSLYWKNVSSYDKTGNLISSTEYDGNGNITGKIEYDK